MWIMNQYIIISNRLPITVSKKDGKLHYSYSSGGLATAVSSLNLPQMAWIGWPGIASDDLTVSEKAQIKKELAKSGCIPVHLTEQEVNLFYEGYANDTLWPLFHYFPSYAQYDNTYWEFYQSVNKKFAKTVRHHASNDATIWIHDYQLMLLPRLVREDFNDASIGYFHHIPFPSYEIFRLLPERKAIVQGLLGADMVGFHIYDYVRHFASSAVRILGATSEQGTVDYNGHRSSVDAFPIGIDYKKYRATLKTKKLKSSLKMLDANYSGQKVLLSVDRLDYSKGIMHRLDAYELLLEKHPEYIGKVTLAMIQVPSRVQIETYKRLRDEIEQAVGRINGRFGTLGWAPISYQFQGLPFEEVEALYARADVALVTPLRDGMNLVAKEYVASKQYRTGVLVLSEMTGASDELIGALMVNPNDIPDMTDTIYKALTMPKSEQRERMKKMQARISDYDVQAWGKDFLQELAVAHTSSVTSKQKKLHSAQIAQLTTSYATATSRLLLLDYDGTLKPFSKDISARASRPSQALLNQLARIARQPRTRICIISGRPRDTLQEWFSSVPTIQLVAEHGAWVKRDGTWHNTTKPFNKQPLLDIMNDHKNRTPGAIVEEKDFALVWHYRQVNPELAFVRNNSLRRELIDATRYSGLGVHNGKKIIEIKPESIHKGAIAYDLLKDERSDFVLVAGDDYTDEDMFTSMPKNAYTIKIGSGATAARYQVSTMQKLTAVIDQLSQTDVTPRRRNTTEKVTDTVNQIVTKPIKKQLRRVAGTVPVPRVPRIK